MKKSHRKTPISLIALLAMLCVGYATASFGAPSHGIKYTKHNFGTTGAGASNFISGDPNPETEICIFCHTPHNAVAGKKFLWNKTNRQTTFQMYTASSTLDFTKSHGNEVSSVSKMCLTCHDGAGAINAMANPRQGGTVTMVGDTAWDQIGDFWGTGDYQMDPRYGPNIGEADIANPGAQFPDDYTNGGILVNDHPISFIFKESSDNDATIKTADGVGGSSIGGLPLWYEYLGNAGGYRVECVTCHDPHINYNLSKGGDPAYTPFLRKTMNSSSLCFTCHNK